MPNDRPRRNRVVQAAEQAHTLLILAVAGSLLTAAYTMKDDGLAVAPLLLACVVLGVWLTLTVQTAHPTAKTQQQERNDDATEST